MRLPKSFFISLLITGFIIGWIGISTHWLVSVILFFVAMALPTAYIIYVYYLGTSMAIRGDLRGAIRHYSSVLNLPVDKVIIYTRRAALRNAVGDIDGAIADYTAAMELIKHPNLNGLQSLLHLGKQNYQIASQNTKRLFELYGIRSALYLGKHDYEKALEDSSHLLELQPNSEIGYANRAAARMFLGDVDGAIADCNAGLKVNISDSGKALLYNNRGTAYRLQENYPEAMSNYNLAMSAALNPNQKKVIHPTVLTNQGILYYLMQEYDNARVYFQQGLDLNQRFYKAMAGLAAARFKLGQAEKALKLWKDLVALEPRYRDLRILQQELNLPMQMMSDVDALREMA